MPGVRSEARAYALFSLSTNLDLSSCCPGVHALALLQAACSALCLLGGQAQLGSGLSNSTLPLPCGFLAWASPRAMSSSTFPLARGERTASPLVHKSIARTCTESVLSRASMTLIQDFSTLPVLQLPSPTSWRPHG